MRPILRAISRYRPRVLTLVLLFLIAVPITLANFTSEIVTSQPELAKHYKYLGPASAAMQGRERRGTHQAQYGWPLIWHWHNLLISPGPCGIFNWEYSPARLAGNMALWTLMAGLPVGVCEWLLRRNGPGLRWSLRTMLIAVAVAAACCAWFTKARNRANLQDPLISELEQDGIMNLVMVDRPAPKWLEFIVPDRLRRRIIGIGGWRDVLLDEELARRLASLPQLQYLRVEVERWTPGMTEALTRIQRLRWLCISIDMDESSAGEGSETGDSEIENSNDERRRVSREFLEGIGKLTQIEALCIDLRVDFAHDDLARLAGLENLKLLVLELGPGTQGSLSHFPALPKLETIHIKYSPVNAQDLRRLAVFPRLKSVDLTGAELDGAELADLAPLEALEELSITAECLPKQSLESLHALKRLKLLKIRPSFGRLFSNEERSRTTSLALDDGDQLIVPAEEADVHRCALETLRQSNPGIVIKEFSLSEYTFDISPPFKYEDPVLYSTWLPRDIRFVPLPSQFGAASASPAAKSTVGQSPAEETETEEDDDDSLVGGRGASF